MESIGRFLIIASCAAWAFCACNDDSCDFGQSNRCAEHSGAPELRYCQADGVWSECVREVECNPLTQEGCADGLACWYESSSTFCAAPDSFPCEPGQFTGNGGCAAFCAHDGSEEYIKDAPECETGEWCQNGWIGLPEGVGLCGHIDLGG
jgi:hypothetical protein